MSNSAAEITSSLSVLEKKELSDTHFRWDSLKKFLFLAFAFSSNLYGFDLFSKIGSKSRVNIFDFILCQIFIGMPYMFMDGFIKQYTRRIDGYKFLNPLLKGISFGQFLQSGFWALIQASYLADSVRYLTMTLRTELPWAHCYAEGKNSTCISVDTMLAGCRHKESYQMEATPAHHHYIKSFTASDRSGLTTRCFVVGLVWLINFFVSTVTDETLVKIYYFSFIFRLVSTFVVVFMLLITVDSGHIETLIDIMDAKNPSTFVAVLPTVAYAYGVGFLGFYDFGTMSPYTMIDTAVIIFSVVFTVLALIRSWIVKLLFIRMSACVKVGTIQTHYLYFAVLPLSTEFVRANKLYAFYVYLNIIVTTSGYLSMLTLAMSKLLHTEFRSVKIIYFVGLICCCGFSLSLPITVRLTTSIEMKGLISGLNVTVLYLGGFKVAIVLWVYGVQRFSTDIQFWLGFKPTRFWTLSWRVLPLVLLVMLIYKIYIVISYLEFVRQIAAVIWFGATILVVAILHTKTISKYLVRNNLASLFTSTAKYGPPDPSDRKNRRHYSETIQLRHCKHNCQVIDELIDCNHMPLMTSTIQSSATSLESITKDIYRAEGPTTGASIKNPSLLDIAHHHY